MIFDARCKSKHVVVDTTAFIRNAALQDIGENIITVPEVINEIKSKRQLRRLAVLPYDLQVKEVFPESIIHVTEFAKKTGDYPSLSSTDLKVMALTYQLEKEHVGTEHLKTAPKVNRSVNYCKRSVITVEDIAGFYKPKKGRNSNNSESSEFNQADDKNEPNELTETLENCNINEDDSEYLSAKSDSSDEEFLESSESLNELKSNLTKVDHKAVTTSDDNDNLSDDNDVVDEDENVVNDLFVQVKDDANLDTDDDEKYSGSDSDEEGKGEGEESVEEEEEDDDDDSGWITPSNVRQVKQEMDGNNLDDKPVTVACLTTDFAMQNVLKQMGLNVISLDGRVIKQMRTFILRCYACFKTTSVMTKVFCHHCGNKTLKKVAVSLDEKGNQNIHINVRRPLTARGKKYSLPKPTGGKHSNYPILFEDQPVPDQRPTRLARTKNNPLDPDYTAGFSPFVMRDVNSKSAMLGVPNKTKEVKYWMRRNPNESSGRKKKKK